MRFSKTLQSLSITPLRRGFINPLIKNIMIALYIFGWLILGYITIILDIYMFDEKYCLWEFFKFPFLGGVFFISFITYALTKKGKCKWDFFSKKFWTDKVITKQSINNVLNSPINRGHHCTSHSRGTAPLSEPNERGETEPYNRGEKCSNVN